MDKSIIYAMYDDDHDLLVAAKKLVGDGIKVDDVFSPFPVHGIDPVIGVKQTRLGIMAFLYGLTGLVLALIGMRYFMITDWPMNVGGKPNMSLVDNLLAFIPVTFEFTVLCTAHGMALTYFLRNGTLPGMPAHNPDPRTTDDKFVIAIKTTENQRFSEEDLNKMLKETKVSELNMERIK